jgi:HD-like signal output (HDOD) protein
MNQTTERSPKAAATLALLWERVRRQGDMPGFTRAIGAILASMRGEAEDEFSMTHTVLSDPVLTQKVLRLANSGMYAAFGQRIDTVSKAVLVLGTEAIGHLALGLKLVEELGNSRPDTAQAHAEMEKAVLAGMVAQQVAAIQALRDPETAAVCAILHSLGRMMVTFYMPERWVLLLQHAGDEHEATLDVLGLTLEAVGRAAAEHWGLPGTLVAGMRSLRPGERRERIGHEDWLAAVATLSAQCAKSLWNDDQAGAEEVRQLAAGYGPMLGIAPERILCAVQQAKVEAAADLTVAPLAHPEEKRAKALENSRQRAAGNRLMMAGVAELREALAHGGGGSDRAMELALEAMHRGLGFSRTIAFVRNRREALYLARMGLGDGVRELLPRLRFGDGYEANAFHAAFSSDRVIFIEHPHDPSFSSKLPPWWKASLRDARSFVILPLSASGTPTGLLYGDWVDGAEPADLGPVEFGLLNNLRTLLATSLAPRHRPGLAPQRVAASRA